LLLRRSDRNDWRTTRIARLKKIKPGATARQVLGAGLPRFGAGNR
jgi:hypothetical protein